MKGKSWKLGEKRPVPASTRWSGPRGGKGPEQTVVKDEPFPPTLSRNQLYVLVDPARTKGGDPVD